MKALAFCFFLLFSLTSRAQYYYNDLWEAGELSYRMENYVKQKVATITAAGYDAQGRKTTDFNEWHEVDAARLTLKIATRNGQQVKREYYQFDSNFRLISIVDSSGDIRSTTTYGYDNETRIVSIKTATDDQLSDFTKTEEHHWIYNTKTGIPEKMWRIVNGTDSTEYRFTPDEKGNVQDEQLYRRGTGIEPVYYYYNEHDELTDIVRYNKWAKKLLPDFMFEYDENGNVIQKVTMLSITRPNFLTWRYIYNDKELKTKEALFNQDKQLQGRIEYSYTFRP